MLDLGIVILVLVCFLVYRSLRRNANYWKIKGVSFETPLPLIGNMSSILLFRKPSGIIIADFYAKFKNERYFGIWLFTVPNLVIRCPDLIKSILVKDFNHFYDRSVACNEEVDALTANMLFFLKNPKWKVVRTKTTPMFSSGKIKYICPQIQTISENMISFINARSDNAIEVKSLCTKYTTDIICSAAFGIDSYSFQDEDTQFTKVGRSVFDPDLKNSISSILYSTNSPLVNMFKIKFLKKWTAKFLTETSLTILKKRELTKSDRRDLIDTMITFKNEHQFSDDELIAQASQFFLAGYETTSSAISSALYELSLNKSIQDKLRKEIKESVNDAEDTLYTTLKNMPYLNKVVSETLRKYPVLPVLGRSCKTDYKIPDSDVVIERGTPIIISVVGLHHDPKYYPNPEVFDPERFTEENISARHPYTYLPFGKGPRNCIGERMALLSTKVALWYILKNFEIEIAKETKIPLEFKWKSFFTLNSNEIYIHFKKIS